MPDHFQTSLAEFDPLVAEALKNERARQRDQLELIASENIVSRAILDVLGHEITNKTLEGYPGARFHGGGKFVDVAEQAAIDRACELFGCTYANVQPHSGSQANLAVYFLLLKPGDKTLSLDLAAGGHLSHGLGANLSGRWFDSHHYNVDRETETINYDALEEQAIALKPKLLIAGGSAYPRELDFMRLGEIAGKSGAILHVDMAHIAGLVAAGIHPSPFPYADIVTCTTTKTMRGPRGGVILTNNCDFAKRLQASVFPGVQGSLHTQVVAAKAVCFKEALEPNFRTYGERIVCNAKALAAAISEKGIRIVTGGTDTHIVLLDLSSIGLTGQAAEDLLDNVNITSNKNPIPFDRKRPDDWVGLRLGTAAVTTRGFGKEDCQTLGALIGDVLIGAPSSNGKAISTAQETVADLCARYPGYGF